MTDKIRYTAKADITTIGWGGVIQRRTLLIDDSEEPLMMTMGGMVAADPETPTKPGGFIRMCDVLEWHSREDIDFEYEVEFTEEDEDHLSFIEDLDLNDERGHLTVRAKKIYSKEDNDV